MKKSGSGVKGRGEAGLFVALRLRDRPFDSFHRLFSLVFRVTPSPNCQPLTDEETKAQADLAVSQPRDTSSCRRHQGQTQAASGRGAGRHRLYAMFPESSASGGAGSAHWC